MLLEKAGLIVPRRKGDLIQSETFYTNDQWRLSNNYHLKEDQLLVVDTLENLDPNLSKNNYKVINNFISEKTFKPRKLRAKIELMNLKKAEKKDLLGRLRSSMIVDESQIAPLVLDIDISASGFEFRRKVNVCKMAGKKKTLYLKLLIQRMNCYYL